ncbi:MAG: hypothetical protein M3M88_06210, partial [Thermoproteota archaeon]|nr:hypothetical protein [Thermoproteota archaeon]
GLSWDKGATDKGQWKNDDKASPLCCFNAFDKQTHVADIQEIAREKRIASQNTKTQSVDPATGWNPTRKLTPITIRPDIIFLTKSAATCPTRRADLAIGSERNRLTIPRCRSTAKFIVV